MSTYLFSTSPSFVLKGKATGDKREDIDSVGDSRQGLAGPGSPISL